MKKLSEHDLHGIINRGDYGKMTPGFDKGVWVKKEYDALNDCKDEEYLKENQRLRGLLYDNADNILKED